MVMPCWRMRSSASALCCGSRDPTASSTTNTCLPLAASSSTVCSTQTCDSMPQTTTCGRSMPGKPGRHWPATQEKCSFAPTLPVGRCAATAECVCPIPFGYCSVAATGTFSCWATCTSQSTWARMRCQAWIWGKRRSCRSITSREEVSARIRGVVMRGFYPSPAMVLRMKQRSSHAFALSGRLRNR